MDTTQARVLGIFDRLCGRDPTPGTDIRDPYLSMIPVQDALEDEFQVAIHLQDLYHCRTIRDVTRLVEEAR